MTGCCGGRTSRKQPKVVKPRAFPGELGFMPLAYIGKSPTPRRWRGQFTGISYLFGGDEIRKLVDRRDGIEFLAIQGDAVFAYDCSESYQTEKT